MSKILQMLLVAGVITTGGHFALRYYLRSAVRKELESNKGLAVVYQADKFLQKASLGKLTLNFPPIEAMVVSLVPLDELSSPADAADDIAVNGRFSKYWPKGYERGSLDPKIERDILQIFGNYAAARRAKEEQQYLPTSA